MLTECKFKVTLDRMRSEYEWRSDRRVVVGILENRHTDPFFPLRYRDFNSKCLSVPITHPQITNTICGYKLSVGGQISDLFC
jgi:hypothetical protein